MVGECETKSVGQQLPQSLSTVHKIQNANEIKQTAIARSQTV